MQYNIVSINRELLKLCRYIRASRFEMYMCACVCARARARVCNIYIVTKLNSIITRIKSLSRGSILILSGHKRRVGSEFFSGSKIENRKLDDNPERFKPKMSLTRRFKIQKKMLFSTVHIYTEWLKKKIKWVTLQYRNLTWLHSCPSLEPSPNMLSCT